MENNNPEIADIIRAQGGAWAIFKSSKLNRDQLQAMNAIERCRTPYLGGRFYQCSKCNNIDIEFYSCRNRHCPKCQNLAAIQWKNDRVKTSLPKPYFHIVFTLPEPIKKIAYQNKSTVYNILFEAASKTLLKIGSDPKHLGAKLGVLMVLHTWGSALTYHPHVHCVVPGGGVTDHNRWKDSKNSFFLPVRVLSSYYKKIFISLLQSAYKNQKLDFYGDLNELNQHKEFHALTSSMLNFDWVVYAKKPFSGPAAVLSYLSLYTHRTAISNRRLLSFDGNNVTFKWKDYRQKKGRLHKVMTLSSDEFIRRFVMHVLPKRFHRIRYYGIYARTKKEALMSLIDSLQDINSETIVNETVKYDILPSQCARCGSQNLSLRDMPRISRTGRGPPYLTN